MPKTGLWLNRAKVAIVASLFLAVLGGCGYHIKGKGLRAPADVHTVAVAIFENRTSESGIETIFTNDLSYEFNRSKILQVVDISMADAVLSGSIASMAIETISHSSKYASEERRVTITLNLALKRSDGKVLWSDKSLSGREVFKVSSDKSVTEENRRAAIEAISKRLAEKIHNRILCAF